MSTLCIPLFLVLTSKLAFYEPLLGVAQFCGFGDVPQAVCSGLLRFGLFRQHFWGVPDVTLVSVGLLGTLRVPH